ETALDLVRGERVRRDAVPAEELEPVRTLGGRGFVSIGNPPRHSRPTRRVSELAERVHRIDDNDLTRWSEPAELPAREGTRVHHRATRVGRHGSRAFTSFPADEMWCEDLLDGLDRGWCSG